MGTKSRCTHSFTVVARVADIPSVRTFANLTSACSKEAATQALLGNRSFHTWLEEVLGSCDRLLGNRSFHI